VNHPELSVIVQGDTTPMLILVVIGLSHWQLPHKSMTIMPWDP
jgi:hypothetical protein